MIQPELALILDVLVAGLLVAVIVYAVRLNRSLTILQKSKQELEQLLAGFSDSTEKAERAVQEVKAATSQNKDTLGGLLSEAEHLKEDLAFLIDRGNSIADRLDQGISAQRGPAPARDGDTASDIEDAMRAARAAADAPERGAKQARSLQVKPDDGVARPGVPSVRGSTEPAVADDDAEKSKKKSALLRALQGMR